MFALQGQTLTQLSSRDFLHRLKLKGDLDAARRIRAKREVDDRESVHKDFGAAVESVKEEFVVKALNYLVFLL